MSAIKFLSFSDSSIRQGKFVLLLALSGIVVGSSGCSVSGGPSDLKGVLLPQGAQMISLSDPSLRRSSESLHSYLVGQMELLGEDYRGALRAFQRADELAPQPIPKMSYRLTELLVKLGNLSQALEKSTKLVNEEPKNPDALLLHAGILEGLGRVKEAIPFYERGIKVTPDKVEPILLLAGAYGKLDKHNESVRVLTELQKEQPKNPVVLYFLGRSLELSGDLPKALEMVNAARQAEGENSSLDLDYARLLLKAGKVQEAKIVCSEVITREPKNLIARRVLGKLLVNENNLSEALTHFKVLEKEEADPTDTRLKIALIQIERREFQDAERELSLILAQKPENDTARYYLATAYASLGKTKEALDELLKVKPGQENYARSRLFASAILQQQGKTERVQKILQEAYAHEKQNKDINSFYVSVLRQNDALPEAEQVLRENLTATPENESLKLELAGIVSELGREKEAQGLVEEILQKQPSHPDAANFLAYSYAEQGVELQRALDLIDAALIQRPADGYFLDTKGWIYYQRKNYQEALKFLERAVVAVGNDALIYEHLGLIREATNDREGALEAYRRAVDILERQSSRSQKESHALTRLKEKIQLLHP